jgi:hypothetical protein
VYVHLLLLVSGQYVDYTWQRQKVNTLTLGDQESLVFRDPHVERKLVIRDACRRLTGLPVRVAELFDLGEG